MRLRSIDAYWDPGSNIPDEAAELVRELDRRFMQLWDKVTFESKHNLVDYEKLSK